MTASLSANTQAILLLTAPLIAGRNKTASDLLTPSEYKRLARCLREQQRQPADLLSPLVDDILPKLPREFERTRLTRLLGRGFLLSQALERWHTRAIWVISRADAQYPKRFKARLKEDAPFVLYGCGDLALVESGGLAVVGSRNVTEELLAYTQEIGRVAARAQRTLVSGGARGVDQAAMRGALDGGGMAVGVLADSLEATVMHREHRNFLARGQLTLVSPYDPNAGFNVGNAMRRNKLVYALSDAALVVNSDVNKGGTWAGAVEQLEQLRLVPVYVRSEGVPSVGLDALRTKGALPWPHPVDPESLRRILQGPPSEWGKQAVGQHELRFNTDDAKGESQSRATKPSTEVSAESGDGSVGELPAGRRTVPEDGIGSASRVLIDTGVLFEVVRMHRPWIDRIKRLHDVGMEAIRAGQKRVPNADHARSLAWMFLARSTTALRSVFNLFCVGDAIDATSVFRTLVELAIDFEYIWTVDHEANVQRYLDFGKIEARRKEQYLAKLYPAHASEIAQSAKDEYEKLRTSHPDLPSYDVYRAKSELDFNGVLPTFSNAKGRLDVSWSRVSIRDRANAVDPSGLTYDLLYALGCEASHSGPGTLSAVYETAVGAPRLPHDDLVLIFSAWLYCSMLVRATHELELPQESVLALASEIGIPEGFLLNEDRTQDRRSR